MMQTAQFLSGAGGGQGCRLGGTKQDGGEAEEWKGEGPTLTTSTKTGPLPLLLCLVRE